MFIIINTIIIFGGVYEIIEKCFQFRLSDFTISVYNKNQVYM